MWPDRASLYKPSPAAVCRLELRKPRGQMQIDVTHGGAVVAGIFLGSISMRTKSIYSGFLLHITVALLMDMLALSHRDALPQVLWPA